MIQSDALSRQPDFMPDDNNDNEEMTMLPDNLFINLFDIDLQQRIANCTATDKDTTDALATLVKDGPSSLKNQLNDWTIEPFEGKSILFYKGKNYIPQDQDLRCNILTECFMTMKRPDILENSKPITPSNNIIGGRDCEPL